MGPIITRRSQIISPWESLQYGGNGGKGVEACPMLILCLLMLKCLLLPMEGNTAAPAPLWWESLTLPEPWHHRLQKMMLAQPPWDLPPVAATVEAGHPVVQTLAPTSALHLQWEPHLLHVKPRTAGWELQGCRSPKEYSTVSTWLPWALMFLWRRHGCHT